MAVNPTLPVVGADDGVWGDILNTAAVQTANEINTHESATDPHGDRAYADTNKLAKSANLSDVNPATARSNLGLGTAATQDVSAFATQADIAAAVTAALAAGGLVNQ